MHCILNCLQSIVLFYSMENIIFSRNYMFAQWFFFCWFFSLQTCKEICKRLNTNFTSKPQNHVFSSSLHSAGFERAWMPATRTHLNSISLDKQKTARANTLNCFHHDAPADDDPTPLKVWQYFSAQANKKELNLLPTNLHPQCNGPPSRETSKFEDFFFADREQLYSQTRQNPQQKKSWNSLLTNVCPARVTKIKLSFSTGALSLEQNRRKTTSSVASRLRAGRRGGKSILLSYQNHRIVCFRGGNK